MMTSPATHRAVIARRTEPAIMKKGRSQGGGPKISLKKKRSKTEGEKWEDKRLSTMARRVATAKKRPHVAPGQQRDRFAQHCEDGSLRHPVFARPTGQPDWVEVGHVSIAPDSAMTAEDAARLQKRLILEHAARLHPSLQQHNAILEAGLGKPDVGGAESEMVEDSNADIEALVEALPSSGDLILIQQSNAGMCGFLGLALPGGHYFGDNSPDVAATDERKVKLSRLGDDGKSAIAEHNSKMLGLRSMG